jgi:glycosyltransferase involved in cell wall biosynthesis
MASGRPILAVTPPEGEVARLIRVAGCGWNVPPTSPRKLAGVIVELKCQASLLDQMGKNGRFYLERYYARSRCVDTYEMMLRTLFNKARNNTAHVEGVL